VSKGEAEALQLLSVRYVSPMGDKPSHDNARLKNALAGHEGPPPAALVRGRKALAQPWRRGRACWTGRPPASAPNPNVAQQCRKSDQRTSGSKGALGTYTC